MNIEEMTIGEKRDALGLLAEEIVLIYYYNSRKGAELSADKWDTVKDLTLGDGAKIEVKAQRRFSGANAFGINNSKYQIEKCETVDELIFVEHYDTVYGTNGEPHPDRDCIRIFKCLDQKAHFSLADEYRNVSRKRFYDIETNTIELACLHLPFQAYLMRELATAK